MEQKIYDIPQPNDPNSTSDRFLAFIELVKVLRVGCPWDRKQTNESISHLLIEECYETLDAIKKKDDEEFSKELGDLLLHVVMHAVMADERGAFNVNDVIQKIHDKLVFRHPHVFGEVVVSGEGEVLNNWENLKKKEGRKNTLDGVPESLPALLRAERIQYKASRVGFDWEEKSGVWDKVEEELKELKVEIEAKNQEKIKEEFGDVFFALVNAARFEDVIPEVALQDTNDKFSRRFKFIEDKAKEMGRELKDMTLGEMDELWDEAKKLEK
jgi:XTP/dITP diphosphohydrolase